MNIDLIYFKGYSCFKKEWAGFDTIKPINVIIGRNNSGKSHLLDLVEALCKDELFNRGWEYRFGGVLDEGSLRGPNKTPAGVAWLRRPGPTFPSVGILDNMPPSGALATALLAHAWADAGRFVRAS